jgi:hypothetical protein
MVLRWSIVKIVFSDPNLHPRWPTSVDILGGHLGWRSGSHDIIFKVDNLRTIHAIFSIGSYVKIKSSHGGHLEFPISQRFTSLVQDHPMIIPAKSQFNWLSGF